MFNIRTVGTNKSMANPFAEFYVHVLEDQPLAI